MEKIPPRETLARNLRHLKQMREWSDATIAKKAGISAKAVNNMINARHSPNIDDVDAVARVFGLTGWHLIMPNLPDDLINSPNVGSLFTSYASADPEGRKVIDMIAEREGKKPKKNNG